MHDAEPAWPNKPQSAVSELNWVQHLKMMPAHAPDWVAKPGKSGHWVETILMPY
jgi:hypothetical protein